MIKTKLKYFKHERIRGVAREGAWIVLGQLLSIVGSLLAIRMLTQFMDPAAYGELALAMTFATLINQIIFGPIGNGIARFYMSAIESGEFVGYLNSIKKIVNLASLFVIILGAVSVACLFLMKEIVWGALMGMTIIFSILSGWSSTISGMQACERRRSLVAMHQGAEPFLRGFFAVGVMWMISSDATMAMSGYVLGMTLLVCSQLFFFKWIIVGRLTKACQNNSVAWQAKVLKYSWPMGVWGIFTAIQLSSDRWALQTFANASDVGMYAVLYQLGFVPISLISGTAVQLVLPIMYKRAGDATNADRIKSANELGWALTKLTLFLTGIAFFIALISHLWVFELLVGERYRIISYLLPWMVLAGGLFAGGQSLSSNLLVQIQTHKMLSIKITTAILGVVLNIIGAHYFGIDGVVAASCIFSLSYLVWMYFLVNSEKKYHED